MKKIKRINESQFRQIISESINKILSENMDLSQFGNDVDSMGSDIATYLFNNGMDVYAFTNRVEKTYEMLKAENKPKHTEKTPLQMEVIKKCIHSSQRMLHDGEKGVWYGWEVMLKPPYTYGQGNAQHTIASIYVEQHLKNNTYELLFTYKDGTDDDGIFVEPQNLTDKDYKEILKHIPA